jgi:hypothetical protein
MEKFYSKPNRGDDMKKVLNFLVLGLLVVSLVAISGCADKAAEPTEQPTNETAPMAPENGNVPPQGPGMGPGNKTMGPGMQPGMNGTMPPANGTMRPGMNGSANMTAPETTI